MSARALRLGLRENLAQFSLLVAVNALVGAMVGLERSTLPCPLAWRSGRPASPTSSASPVSTNQGSSPRVWSVTR